MPFLFAGLVLLTGAAPLHAEVIDRQVKTLPMPERTALSIATTVGDVSVEGWNRPELSIEVVRRAPDRAALERLPVHIEPGANGMVVRVTQRDGGRDASLRGDVSLRVPRTASLTSVDVFEGTLRLAGLSSGVTARVERGSIASRGLTGAIRLEAVKGGIAVTGTAMQPGTFMRLRTFNGDVTVALPAPPTDARILLLSLGGRVRSDLRLNRQEKWGPRFAEATFGTGEPVLSVDVVNGDITLTAAKGTRGR